MTSRNAADMQKTFKLPLLPGQTCGEELLRTNFRKTQLLSGTGERSLHLKEVPVDFDSTRISQTAAVGLSGSQRGFNGTATQGSSANQQGLDRRVLRFFGYFTESVTESSVEKHRVRRVILCYFLEDDTISVSEPRQDNSGIAFQGCMVKRHQIPRADNTGIINFNDLAVGVDLSFYGRTFHLTDCDAFTREFMAQMGAPMGPAEEIPSDAYATTRAPKTKPAVGSMQASTNASGMKVKLSASEVRAAKQFLENDRRVLRLKALWDDSTNLYGHKHFFTLYYFLADDTIELVEDYGANSGKDPFPSFCRRQRILKPRPGGLAGTGVTFGQKEAQADAPAYTDADLRIGNTITIFGRDFLLYDYDSFTRDHLKQKFGIVEYNPINVADPPKAPIKREPPPYNGYGSEEDSLVSWRSLDMKPPRKSNDLYEKFGDSTVKFSLKLDNGVANDENRRFVLSCFLADKTIAIYETVLRNSGILGGKFLQRQPVKNPETDQNFVASDFYVGQKVVINKFPFEVIGTDERSLSFMEANSSTFNKSNINAAVAKIQAMLLSARTGLAQAFRDADSAKLPLDVANLTTAFASLGLEVSQQELITVLRFFERNGETNLTYQVLAARLLDIDERPETYDASWEEVLRARSGGDVESLSVRDRVEAQTRRVQATTAAYAARAFAEQYQQRRHLFHSEFKFITDYSTDGKIGEEEFRAVVTQKLRLPLSDAQVDALAASMFPPRSRRITFEELVRLFNNNSNFEHNIAQIKSRRE